MKIFVWISGSLAIVTLAALYYAVNPFVKVKAATRPNIPADTNRLRGVVQFLTGGDQFRTYLNIAELDRMAEYIKEQLAAAGGRVQYQEYTARGNPYKNVIGSFGPEDGARIIIGAHYDVCGDQAGADDNASGVAGVLELARLIQTLQPQLNYRVDLIAYSLEEPPFFRTEFMGSAVHAASLYNDGVQVKEMLTLEMIGYFSDEEGSQSYPLPILKPLYPSKANFIAVVGQIGARKLVENCRVHMLEGAAIDVRSINAPAIVPGIDLSDHRSYWKYGYPALMITNTAFYRNDNYHETSDTIETLDFARMAEVVKGVYWHLVQLQTS